MRNSLTIVLSTVCVAVFAGVSASSIGAEATERESNSSGCATVAKHDSEIFMDFFRDVVAGPNQILRTQADLPMLPADSVQFGGTGAQCDSVLSQYLALRSRQTGYAWPTVPLTMLRVGPTRWVGDPHVGNPETGREWIIIDSTFKIVKVWTTTF